MHYRVQMADICMPSEITSNLKNIFINAWKASLSPTHPSSHSAAQLRKSFGGNCSWTLFSHLMKDVLQAKYAAALTNLILKPADTLQKIARIISVTNSVQSSAHRLVLLLPLLCQLKMNTIFLTSALRVLQLGHHISIISNVSYIAN